MLGLSIAALWGTGDLLAALAARKFGAFRTLAFAQIIELGLCVAVWTIFRPSLLSSVGSAGMLLLAGVLTAGAYGALYQGLMLGPVTLVGPIASTYAVGPTVLAVVLLGEHLPTDGWIGCVAAIAGVGVVSAAHAKASAKPSVRERTGVPYGFAAMAGFAISAFMIAAFAQQLGWLPPLLLSRIGVALTLAAVVLFVPRSQRSRGKGAYARWPAILAVGAGLCNLVGTALYAHAGDLELVAVVSPISATFPLVPIVGGMIFFHERVGLIEVVGIGAIIAGLILLG
jgi:drug/metabolite transporter (DMT)-like permease